jgi:hypothetical protein
MYIHKVKKWGEGSGCSTSKLRAAKLSTLAELKKLGGSEEVW